MFDQQSIIVSKLTGSDCKYSKHADEFEVARDQDSIVHSLDVLQAIEQRCDLESSAVP